VYDLAILLAHLLALGQLYRSLTKNTPRLPTYSAQSLSSGEGISPKSSLQSQQQGHKRHQPRPHLRICETAASISPRSSCPSAALSFGKATNQLAIGRAAVECGARTKTRVFKMSGSLSFANSLTIAYWLRAQGPGVSQAGRGGDVTPSPQWQ
jgi:hypothetical protein